MAERTIRHVTDIAAEEFRARYPELLDPALPENWESFAAALYSVFENHWKRPQYEPWDAHPRYRVPPSSGGHTFGLTATSRRLRRMAESPLGRFDEASARLVTYHLHERDPYQHPEELLVNILGFIRLSMSIADSLTITSPATVLGAPWHRWQDAMLILIGDDENRELVESLTVNGVVLDDLVAAVFG